MEFSSQPSRVELAVPVKPVEVRTPPEAVTGRPETAKPVLAADAIPATPAPIKGLGIPPLDMFEVGDNDEVPLPPEPPREAIVRARIAPEPEPDVNIPNTEQTSEAPTPDVAAAPPSPNLPEMLENLTDGPANPTVDIRR